MRVHAPPDIFTRYDDHITQQAVRSQPGWNDCANPNCNDGGFDAPNADDFFTCRTCHKSTCIVCETMWHPGVDHEENLARIRRSNGASRISEIKEELARLAQETAGQSGSHDQQRRLQEELDSLEAIMAFAKPCPRCQIPLQKNGGCNHMTCEYNS
jgi:hypothetical protein